MGALILRRSSIVLVQRGKPPLQGYWSLPGGVLELGEQLADAVRREVLEETGLQVAPLGIFEVFERILRNRKGVPEYHYVLVDYLCKVTGGELAASDDARRAAWVRKRDLGRYKLTEGSREVIERAFARRSLYG